MKVGLFYQSEQYDSLEHSGNYGKLAVKVPGHSGIMQMRFSVPILDMHGYWVPESRTPSTKIVWVIESKSAGQRAFPFIAFFNSRQINRLSAGLTNLTDDARILAKMNQEKCTYDITIEVALGKDSQDFELVIDQRPQVWTDSLADWRKALALPLPEFPEGAWEPVFCTWYAVHAGSHTGLGGEKCGSRFQARLPHADHRRRLVFRRHEARLAGDDLHMV